MRIVADDDNGNDWTDDPDVQKWLHRTLDELVPMIEGSTITASIVPTSKTDIKFAVELGLAIMLDKPVAIIVQPGQQVPEHLLRVADEVIEWGPDLGQRIAKFADRQEGP